MDNLTELPKDLPVPIDDGACDHLTDKQLPDINLPTTAGYQIHLSRIEKTCVLYFYPMTGQPGTPLPDDWDSIPGARGCTPQSCSFRDHYSELQSLDCDVYGISSQDSDYQKEAKDRLHLPFELISDDNLILKYELDLPTFHAADMELYKRFTLIVHNQIIVKVFYPVFPPHKNPDDVIDWLNKNKLNL